MYEPLAFITSYLVIFTFSYNLKYLIFYIHCLYSCALVALKVISLRTATLTNVTLLFVSKDFLD